MEIAMSCKLRGSGGGKNEGGMGEGGEFYYSVYTVCDAQRF